MGLTEGISSGVYWRANTMGNTSFLTLNRRRLSLSFEKISAVLMILALMDHSTSLPPKVLQVILGISSLTEWPIYKHIPGFIAFGLHPFLKWYTKHKMSRSRHTLILLTTIFNTFESCFFSSASLKSSRRQIHGYIFQLLAIFSCLLAFV